MVGAFDEVEFFRFSGFFVGGLAEAEGDGFRAGDERDGKTRKSREGDGFCRAVRLRERRALDRLVGRMGRRRAHRRGARLFLGRMYALITANGRRERENGRRAVGGQRLPFLRME